MTFVPAELVKAARPPSDVDNGTSAEELSVAGIAVLEAAQALRRAVAQDADPAASVAVLAALEATLDSLGASLAELRRAVLEQVRTGRSHGVAGRAQQLDAARLVARIGENLAEAATACGELRAIIVRRPRAIA